MLFGVSGLLLLLCDASLLDGLVALIFCYEGCDGPGDGHGTGKWIFTV